MKKKISIIVFGCLVAGIILFFAGPRPKVDTTIRPVEIPVDIEAYLARSEARFSDIKPGTEKTVIRADPLIKAKTGVAVVYLHGFSASRQEIYPLCHMVAERLSANLYYTRLTGHGRSDDALADATVNDWLNDAVASLMIGKRLGNRVIVIGTSNGGALATWLAAQPVARDVLAFVLISPNFGLRSRASMILTFPWADRLTRLIVGEYRSWKPFNEAQARYWTSRYPSRALVQMMAMVQLARSVPPGSITQPVLMIHSPKDEIVDSAAARKRFEKFGSEKKRLVEMNSDISPKNHLIVGDIISPQNNEKAAEIILEFIQPLL